MKRRPRHPLPEGNSTSSATDAEAILQVKIWLLGISPMVWRRVLVPPTFTLRELLGDLPGPLDPQPLPFEPTL